ncbi:MAG: hypothetical protein ACI9AD_001311 [Nitriliruptoraceae bacterium]|jgi:hypothetical protein
MLALAWSSPLAARTTRVRHISRRVVSDVTRWSGRRARPTSARACSVRGATALLKQHSGSPARRRGRSTARRGRAAGGSGRRLPEREVRAARWAHAVPDELRMAVERARASGCGQREVLGPQRPRSGRRVRRQLVNLKRLARHVRELVDDEPSAASQHVLVQSQAALPRLQLACCMPDGRDRDALRVEPDVCCPRRLYGRVLRDAQQAVLCRDGTTRGRCLAVGQGLGQGQGQGQGQGRV